MEEQKSGIGPLDDDQLFFGNDVEHDLAGNGRRLVNYLIDIFGYFIFSFIIGIFLAVTEISLPGLTAPEDPYSRNPGADKILELIWGILLISTYYVSFEYFTGGKTPGKYLTGTRAVDYDGNRMDFGTALKRTLCRLIPFDAFSYLSSEPGGWHDSVSATKVIMDKNWRG